MMGHFIFDRYRPKEQLQSGRECLSHRSCFVAVESELKKSKLQILSNFL